MDKSAVIDGVKTGVFILIFVFIFSVLIFLLSSCTTNTFYYCTNKEYKPGWDTIYSYYLSDKMMVPPCYTLPGDTLIVQCAK